MPAVLDKLDAQITSIEGQAAEAKSKAEEKRNEITNGGESLPEVGSEDFKALTDELDGHYTQLDELTNQLTDLKSQRATVARTIGEPATGTDAGGELKGISPDQLRELVDAARGKSDGPRFHMGTRVVEGEKYKALAESGVFKSSNRIRDVMLGKGLDRAEFKDLISGAGVAPFKDPMRTPFQPLAQRPIRILELLQTIPTDSDAVKYAQQQTAGHNVGIVADPTTAAAIGSGDPAVTPVQAGLKPESAYTFVEKTAEIETLAHGLPIHKNQLADIPGLETILNEEMIRGLYLFLEAQVVGGTGGTGQLRGIANTTGIVTQAKGSDSVIVALHKALTGCRLLFEEPNVVVIHPSDWEAIRLLRDDSGAGAGTGQFLFGPPSQAGDSTLWGMRVVTTPVVAKGTPIIGDFSGAQLYLREGVQVLASDSHADFFMRNLIMLLAEMRAGFGVRRPGAFGKVTGA